MKKVATTAALLLILSFTFVSISEAGTVEAEPKTIVVPDDYSSIQEAVDAASEGDIIYVKSGTYNETILINKTLSLMGENKETTIINGYNKGPVVLICKDNVKVIKFTILNGDTPSPSSQYFPGSTRLAGVHLLSVSNCSIVNNDIANSGCGIWLYDSKNNKLVENNITNNSNGILVDASSQNSLTKNTIKGGFYGIRLHGSPNNKLRDNSILDTTAKLDITGSLLSHINDVDVSNTVDGKAVYYLVNEQNLIINPSTFPDGHPLILVNCTAATIQDLDLTNNWNGIYLAYSQNSTIIRNKISNSNVGIFLAYSNNTQISENVFESNNQGIRVFYNSYNNHISKNWINYCGTGVSVSFSPFRNILEENRISNCTTGIYIAQGAHQNTAQYNEITGYSYSSGKSSNYGIALNCDSNNIVIGNNISDCCISGINLLGTNDAIIKNNHLVTVTQRNADTQGLYLDNSDFCTLSENFIEGNHIGIRFWASDYNTISRNIFRDNDFGYVFNAMSVINRFFHNNFIDNGVTGNYLKNYVNYWDNGYPSGGNYWSDYEGTDNNGDGIGDAPYVIAENNQDNYPLMAPLTIFDAGTWEWTSYNVDVISNSTVSDFSFNPESALIRFNIDGKIGTTGFCRVTIPKGLLDAEYYWTILVDDTPLIPLLKEDADNTYLYFTYRHGIKTVEVIGTDAIPEFPSWIILPLFLMTVLFGVILRKRIRYLSAT
jgi:parallel beta-helix repeat protein